MRNLAKDIDLEDDDYETFEQFKRVRPNWKGPKSRNAAKDKIRAERQRREHERQEMVDDVEENEYGLL